MLGIGSLINPRLGLSIVKNQIEKHIKANEAELLFFETTAKEFTADCFDLIFDANAKKIDFRIYFNSKVKKYFFADSEKLCDIILKMIKEKMKDGTIDYTIINVNPKTIKADVYYTTETGEKLKNTIDL